MSRQPTTVWLSRDVGDRALLCCTSKYQRELIMGLEPWTGTPMSGSLVGGKGVHRGGLRYSAGSYAASRKALGTALAQAGVATHSVMVVPAYGWTLSGTIEKRQMVILGEVRRGFVDDVHLSGLNLAMYLVLASSRDGIITQELRDWLDDVADVEELFARIDGVPRGAHRCPTCNGLGVRYRVNDGALMGIETCGTCNGDKLLYDETAMDKAVRLSQDADGAVAALAGGKATMSDVTIEDHPTLKTMRWVEEP